MVRPCLHLCALRGAVLVCVVVVLNACAPLGRTPTSDSAATAAAGEHARAVAAIENWRLAGRIGVQHDDEGFSADLEWRQSGAHFDIRIIAPLNGGTFALSGDEREVALVTAKGEVYRAASAEALMARHLGWSIPLSGTRYWVRGIPAPRPAASQERHDAFGRWTDFAQSGWRISILDYRDDRQPALPRKLFLSRDTLKVRMVIKHWEPR